MNGRIDLEKDSYTFQAYASETINGEKVTGVADISMTLEVAVKEGYISQEDINQQEQKR